MTRRFAFVGSLLGILLLASIATGLWWHFREGPPADTTSGPSEPLRPVPGSPWFTDVTKAAGIDFIHFDPGTDIDYIMETMGSGVAWIDYDNDGWPDLFLVQDGPVHPGNHTGP